MKHIFSRFVLISLVFVLHFFQVFVCLNDFLFQPFFIGSKGFCQLVVAQCQHLYGKDGSVHGAINGNGGYRYARRHLDDGIKRIHCHRVRSLLWERRLQAVWYWLQ